MSEPDPKSAAQQARGAANAKSEYVRHLRILLGQAMREETEAKAAAREAEAKAR